MSTKKTISGNFSEVESRVKRALGLKNSKQLIDMLGIPQSTYSNRKKADNFSGDWIITIHLKYDLRVEWILKGIGEKYPSKKKRILKCEFLETVDNWVSELKKEDLENEAWFKVQFKKLFPEFKEWLGVIEAAKKEQQKAA